MTQAISALEVRDAQARVGQIFPHKAYITKGEARGMEHVVQQIARYVPRGRLLDLGCGVMSKTAVFQQLGFECCAVDDLSEPWHTRSNNIKLTLDFADRVGIRFQQQSFYDPLPFPLRSFDVVTILAVIEHLHESPRSILNVAGRYLRDEGLLCVTMPNAVNMRKRASVLFGSTNYCDVELFYHSVGLWRGHVREYTLAETEYICEASGFEVLSATTYEGLAYEKLKSPFLQLFLVLGRCLPRVRSVLCVLARKPTGWQPVEPDADAQYRSIVKVDPRVESFR
jgi:SAM-dependent methyltransferase